MKKVLVTGASGFIGFYIAKHLADHGDQVTVIDNFTRNNPDADFLALTQKENVKFIQADLTERKYYQELDSYYDEIYHLAAINGTKYFYSKPYEVLRVNILSLMTLLEWTNPENCGKFIFTSSSEAYAGTISSFGQEFDFLPSKEDIPLCINDIFNERFSYGGSKLAGELLTVNYYKKVKVPYAIIRYHNIYGPRMGFEHVIPEFCKRIHLNENPFKVYGGDQTRAFCYIDDAVLATVAVMRNAQTTNEVFHIGNDTEEIRIDDLASKLLALSGSSNSIQIEEAPKGSVLRRCPDISKLKFKTGFNPAITLEEGLSKTMTWYANKYAEMEASTK